ncbi:hypothetical protein [Kitasatospora aureofaciens]|uniref:hypothetical protein n=1 Tax=Kitasatospora aureofaciens TaxID=1894 RepID=UPI0033FD0950
MINADQTMVQVTDTPTVDLTLTGSGTAASPYNVSAVVRLDPNPPAGTTNLIKAGANGLYLECANLRGCFSAGDGLNYDPATGVFKAKISGTAGNTTVIGGDGGLYTPSTGQVSVLDTATVDMTLTGAGSTASPYVLSSTVRLDPAPPGGTTNLIKAGANGLYLECANLRGCFSAGPGLDYDPATGQFKAKISGTAGNTTSISGDGGLYTPVSGQVTVQDTVTVDHTLTGTGSTASPYVLSSTVRLDPAPPAGGTNLIKTGTNGLYIECANVRGCFSAGDGLTYDPATGVFKAKISSAAGNTTSISGDGGLYTPSTGQVTAVDTATVDHTLTGTGSTASPYVLSSTVRLDPAPPAGGNNLLKAGPGGLYIECANVRGCFSAGNGLTYDPATGVFKAKLSADGGNSLAFGTDGGLWAPVGGGGGGTIVQILDTSSVDMGITGTGAAGDPYIITSNVRLDPTPPGGGSNLLRLNANGLYIECANIRGCFSAGPGINYDPATGVIAAKVSTDAGNATKIGTDGGIYTPSGGGGGGTVVQAGDTPTVDTTVTGSGTAASPYVVSSAVILNPAPPAGGSNLIKSSPGGLYLECAQVRSCITAGNGAAFTPASGTVAARLSTDAGNTASFGTDGGILVPPASVTVGCGLTGNGTAANPIVAAPVAAQRAWTTDWSCDAAANSTLHCDPGTGKLWTPPEHTAAAVTAQQNHPLGTPTIGPTGGFILIDPVNAFAQGVYTADSLSACRGVTFSTHFSGHVEVTWTAGTTVDLGYGVSVNGGPAFVRIGSSVLTTAGPAGHQRFSWDVTQATNLAPHTGYNVTIYPAIQVLTGSVTINQWVTDTQLIALTR